MVLRALEASRSSVAARKNDIRPLTVSCLTQSNRAGITICPYLTVIAQGYDRCAELSNKQLSIEAKTEKLLEYLRELVILRHVLLIVTYFKP